MHRNPHNSLYSANNTNGAPAGLLQIIYLGESIVALGTTALAGDCPVLQVMSAAAPASVRDRAHAQALLAPPLQAQCRIFWPLNSDPPAALPSQILGIALGAVVVWTLFMSIYHVEADQHQHAMRQVRCALHRRRRRGRRLRAVGRGAPACRLHAHQGAKATHMGGAECERYLDWQHSTAASGVAIKAHSTSHGASVCTAHAPPRRASCAGWSSSTFISCWAAPSTHRARAC